MRNSGKLSMECVYIEINEYMRCGNHGGGYMCERMYALLHMTAQLPGLCMNGSSVMKVAKLNGQRQSSMDCQCKFAASTITLLTRVEVLYLVKIRNMHVIARSVHGYADGWGGGAKKLNVVRCLHTHQ